MSRSILKKTSHKYASLYFLLILIFSVLYWLFPSGFKAESTSFISYLYFSVVTITTLGYGDVTPTTDSMKLLVVAQAVSGVVLIGLFVNSLMNEQSEKEQRYKHIELLDSINRGMYRIGEASIDFRFYFPLGITDKHIYEGILNNAGVLLNGEVITSVLPKVGVFTYQNNSRGPWRLNIPFDSILRPPNIIGYVIREHFFNVEIYKEYQTIEEITLRQEGRRPPDLAVEVQTEIKGNCDQSTIESHSVYYDVQNSGFEVQARDYNILPQHWYHSGAISSSLDLLGSQIVIRVQKKQCFADKNEDTNYDTAKMSTILKWITIDLRGFPRICLQNFRFSCHRDYDGYPLFVTQLPTTMAEIRGLHPSETLEYQSKISGAKEGTLLGWFRLYGKS